jgi:hypothetical protein
VPVDQLLTRVYGEAPPQRARGTLHSYLSRLRQAVGPGTLIRRHHGYVLTADARPVPVRPAGRGAGPLAHARDAWQQALDIFDTLQHPQAETVRTKLDAPQM